MGRVVCSARAALRLREAAAWLGRHGASEEVLVVGASYEAASQLVRTVAAKTGTGFGWHRLTLGRLAAELAKLELASRELAPVGALPIEALCARVLHRLGVEGRLGRLAAVVDQPGLPRALARTLTELRLAGAIGVDGDPLLAAALAALDDELARARLADRAQVFRIATAVAGDPARHLLLGLPIVWLDVPLRSRAEQQLVRAMTARSPDVLATLAGGDDRTAELMVDAVGDVQRIDDGSPARSLGRVQALLFKPEPTLAELDDSVAIFSAPGESRECVELARRVLREAERGVRFDQMAVLLRSPAQYRVHLEEALGRAGVPVHFDQGTVLPDPSGRAFLALLGCAAEGLSARRFAEYVSLGEVPDAGGEGVPPAAAATGERWVPPDEELLPAGLAARAEEPGTPSDLGRFTVDALAAVAAGTLRAPWRWERLLVDAAVIGGRARWARRLDGLEAKLRLAERDDGGQEATAASREGRARALRDLDHLRRFALPLLDDLERLPASATWGEWLDRLAALASRALRDAERVLGVLAALAPMSEVGPVTLREVQLVLAPRLTDLVVMPATRRHGRLLVAPIDAARGLAFEVVFVPGLAERMFPQKLAEDPLLLDSARAGLALGLATRTQRLADERLALHLAIGAASDRVVLSYPRIDLDQGRPRVPSFYGLEVLEAAEGSLPGFDELGRRADVTGAARIGWPAPADPVDAIDEAECDLALLDPLLRPTQHAPAGAAAYLLGANPHLARSLRFRARRWTVKAWKEADGLIARSDEGRAALAAHAPSLRSFSPTALEQLAACPYRFALRTIVRLETRDDPEAIESLGPLERGSLVHEVQFELLGELREAGLLPVRELAAVRDRLDAVLDRVAARYHDELCPAIDRVWDDGIASIRADLREMWRQMTEDPEWTPRRFELAFGPVARGEGRDPASVDTPVEVGMGLSLRGSIDLVEQSAAGAYRATDYKTGTARVPPLAVIAGGTSLQPVLYALVLEQLFPGASVSGGRLYYCTTRGGFKTVDVPLDDEARQAARVLGETLAHHFERGFFPAAPEKDACKFCDFRAVCGPYEELRTRDKQREPLAQLTRLRTTR
ncbi:MAG: ATP-dependent nuclease, subunit [Deltaproteobacteria bacterium]|nr:ATP-dependent nuclease, subunit [Deltaproteobacteria bacterium]